MNEPSKPSLFSRTTILHQSRPTVLHWPDRGFALIITLALMVLLTLLVVGLLTISSVSLREVSHGEAMAAARANARMSLIPSTASPTPTTTR